MAFPLLPAAGTLHPKWAVDLLVSAQRRRFSGSLVVRKSGGSELRLGLAEGLVTGWAKGSSPLPGGDAGAAGPGSLEEILAELLPPEQIAFCQTHAERREIDLLGAAAELRFLDAEALARLRKEGLLRELRSLLRTCHELDYEFQAHEDKVVGFSPPLEPAVLIADLLEHLPALEAYRTRIQGLGDKVLAVPDVFKASATELRRGPRQVLQSLARSPESFETLRTRNLVPEPTLVATVYALLACTPDNVPSGASKAAAALSTGPGLISDFPRSDSEIQELRQKDTVRIPHASQPPPTHPRAAPLGGSERRETNRSGSYRIAHTSGDAPRESVGPESAAFGPRPTPPAPHRPYVKSPQEREVESRVLDAWLRAVDDKSYAPKALRWAEKAADYFPKNSSILFYLACLLAMNDHPLEAEAVLVHLLKLDPEHLEAQSELKQLQKLNCLQSRPRPKTMLNRWGIRKSL